MATDGEKKKSKYFRDVTEQESKLFRTKDNKPESKYLRKKEKNNEEKNGAKGDKKEYRDIVVTPKRAREMLLEEEKKAEQEPAVIEEISKEITEEESFEALSKTENEAVSEAENEEHKGNAEEIFKKDKKTEEASQRRKNSDYSKNLAIIRVIICLIVLVFTALLLKFAEIKIPFTKGFLTVDFSTLPELVASIAYGPLFGVAICIVKNVVHIMLRPEAAMSDFTNIIIDSVFVFIAGLLYSRSMFYGDKKVTNPKDGKIKDYRRKRIFTSSLSGAVISLVPQFFITRFVAYPLLESIFGSDRITLDMIFERYVESYAALKAYLPEGISSALPEFKSLSGAILMINIPLTIGKLFIVTVITAVVYNWISPFLHYRKKPDKKKG